MTAVTWDGSAATWDGSGVEWGAVTGLPNKDLTWYVDNVETVDTGTDINVRELQTTVPGVAATGQTFNVTHTGDNVSRWWNPATSANADANDPNSVLLRRGWAIPLDRLTPGDARCQVLIPAQTITVVVDASLGWTGSPAGASNMSAKASLWRYDPTTDVGVLIASGTQAFPDSWGGLGNPGSGAYQTANVSITVPETTLERGELLLVQIGAQTGTMSNPVLGGTVNYSSQLRIGTTTASRVILAEPLQALCAVSDTSTGKASTLRDSITLSVGRSIPAIGVPDRSLLIVYTSSVSEAVGTSSRRLTVSHDQASVGQAVAARTIATDHAVELHGRGNADRYLVIVAATRNAEGGVNVAYDRTWDAYREGVVDAIVEPSRVVEVGVLQDLEALGDETFVRYWEAVRFDGTHGVGEAAKALTTYVNAEALADGLTTFSRLWDAFRYMIPEGVGTTAFDRTVIFVRSVDVAGVGVTDPDQARISLPLSDLPAAGDGGTVVIRKIFPIFD